MKTDRIYSIIRIGIFMAISFPGGIKVSTGTAWRPRLLPHPSYQRYSYSDFVQPSALTHNFTFCFRFDRPLTPPTLTIILATRKFRPMSSPDGTRHFRQRENSNFEVEMHTSEREVIVAPKLRKRTVAYFCSPRSPQVIFKMRNLHVYLILFSISKYAVVFLSLWVKCWWLRMMNQMRIFRTRV